MKCPKCGNEVSKEDLFCQNCGNKLGKIIKCVKCGAEIFEDNDFCPECGASQTETNDSLICPECGATNEKDSKFCIICGYDFTGKKSKEKKKTKKVEVEPKIEEVKEESKKEEIPVEPSIKNEVGDTTEINPILDEPKKKSPVLAIVLISVGGALVLAIVGVLCYFMLFKHTMPFANLFKSKDASEEIIEVIEDFIQDEEPIIIKESKEEIVETETYTFYELEAKDNVRVRNYSTTDSSQVGKIAKGSTIRAYDVKDGDDGLTWYCINNGEWVANDGSFFNVSKSTATGKIELLSGSQGKINVKKDALVYKKPSTDSESTGWLTESTKLQYYNKISEEGKTWLQISSEGYILYDYVEYYYK